MNIFAEHPELQEIVVYAALWAILCVGVCLPLITLRLYWSSLLKLFPKESAYHEFDRALYAPPQSKTGAEAKRVPGKE